ncbi:TIGR04222 domain-containing membrane protein [Xanthomonas maliensis]|uniref:TIGR04222 domain-containing membrane protein n=1 Tax=Xanthomonas maliensis TaxID=1321368 RepID=UPI0003A3859B|nr:TIGR04222 domain-containing membrane protein [Xanthomonas maliensis]KAB7771046.1 TIGR04222 domain-containing membrane protein [Xanthomonas maliensis]
MSETAGIPAHATAAQQALWTRLQAYRFGDGEEAQAAFVRRVAREAHCGLALAQQLLDEYRRFCFLACSSDEEASPSPLVDQVWHAHLTDTREYWQRFCPQILQATLHHHPGSGADDAPRLRAQYQRTLERYRHHFGEPPLACWPPPRPTAPPVAPAADGDAQATLQALRGDRPPSPARRRLLRLLAWALVTAVVGALLLSLQPQASSPLQWRGPQFLLLFALLIGLSWSAGAWLRRVLRHRQLADVCPLDRGEVAYLSGGADRLADQLFTELLVSQAVILERDDDRRARPSLRCDPRRTVPPALMPALDAVRTAAEPGAAWRALRALAAPVQQGLIDKGLWLAPTAARTAQAISALPVAAVWVLGACKIVIGLQGQHPVGYLLGAMVVVSALVLGFALIPLRHTTAGERALERYRQTQVDSRARAGIAPGELVALYGTAALVGTLWEDYHLVRAPPGSSTHSVDTTSCGGGGDSGCGSGGDGGGGCGGCGGGGD